ncbi:MAG: FAD-dependent oxidoreductase [Deltaproteobacteria bacterium CG11_big_fil_rev_8_21_14_0_20_49_13]|nr:MAG: FAD-dependent oxidoreductase [Deltaproteobacteria bacterium CG11_big_fil_rev_8_21_14_0_20_49_13]
MYRPKIVIIGAGFGGLAAAKALSKENVDVTIIDRNNFHTFLPLLYQVSSAEIEESSIIYPIRGIINRYKNVDFVLGEVLNINFTEKKVAIPGRELFYEHLILATGSDNNFYNTEGAAENTFTIKTLDEGIALRNHILTLFELADHETDPAERKKLLTFVVIGAGATGIEFTAAFAELVRGPLKKDYKHLNFGEVSIVLIDSRDRLVYYMPETLSDFLAKRLKKLGVTIRHEVRALKITSGSIILNNGETIRTATVVWTAGVAAATYFKEFGIEFGANGRIKILPTLEIEGTKNAYAIGDVAGELAMIAPVAIQQGRKAAENILREIYGKRPVTFAYKDKGFMMVAGRNSGIARIGNFYFKGFWGWFMWLFAHIFWLIGFKNRSSVLFNWAWDYFFFDRMIRLIHPTCKRLCRTK